MRILADASAIRSPLMAFLAMGTFWGAWHALIPQVRVGVGADDGSLGMALLFVAVGAVPAMVAGGRLLDRLGARLLPASVLAFAASAALPGLTRTPVELGAALLVLGMASGLMDVAMNARVGAIEAETGRRAMHLAHGLFAVVYLVVALLTGLARDAGAGTLAILAAVNLAIAAFALASRLLGASEALPKPSDDASARAARRFDLPIVLLGAVAFAAFLAENGWQSWSALFLERTFGVDPTLGSMGPATVGVALAVGRFGGQALARRVSDVSMIVGAALTAILGGAALALASSPMVALAALFVAAAGVSVIAPSALSLAGRTATPERRGAAVAAVGVIAYTGFFAGPALLGFVADASGLRAAFGVIVAVLVLAIPCIVMHRAQTRRVPAVAVG